MVDNWEEAQEEVARAVKGKVTPGSGSGRIKGDVQKEGWGIEVKYFQRKGLTKGTPTYTIQKSWLNKLDHQLGNGRDLLLVVFVGDRGVPYFLEPGTKGHGQDTSWKTVSFTEDNFPKVLYSEEGTWNRGEWKELYQL